MPGPAPSFRYADLLPRGGDTTPYRLLTTDGVRAVEAAGRTFLEVSPEALRLLTETAMHDIAHFLRPAHLAQLRRILDDPEASGNDRYVALDLLKNANVAAGGVLPMCQDTGTAIVLGKRGSQVLSANDEEAVSRGVFDAYTRLNLRYSQLAPLTMWDERNTGSNLPAQVEIMADTKPGHETQYELLFMAKGGGSANKSFLYQETKAVLNPEAMLRFLRAAGDARRTGSERIGGVQTTRYSATVDLTKYPELVPPEQREEAERTVELMAKEWGTSKDSVDVWIDDQDLIRRERMRFTVPVEKGSTAEGVMIIDFAEVGRPRDIEVPAGSDVVDVTDQAAAELDG